METPRWLWKLSEGQSAEMDDKLEMGSAVRKQGLCMVQISTIARRKPGSVQKNCESNHVNLEFEMPLTYTKTTTTKKFTLKLPFLPYGLTAYTGYFRYSRSPNSALTFYTLTVLHLSLLSSYICAVLYLIRDCL